MPRKGQETDILERLKFRSKNENGCWIWMGKTVGNTHGYGAIWYKGKMVRIGRLICHLYHNANLDDNSWVAAHKSECTSSLCWKPEHLYVTTTYQNIQDQIKAGTFHYGTDNLNGGENFDKEKWIESKNRKKE